jgi:3-oxoacyl-[acyl-carrier protein] reductase
MSRSTGPSTGDTQGKAPAAQAQADATLAKIPFGRYGKPEEIGQVVAFLVSDLGSWVTGQTIVVDGGQTL